MVQKLGELPAAVQDPAIAALDGDRFVLLGGLDAADTSSADITVLSGANVQRHDSLPIPQHDAQAALLGSDVYVFGGGEPSLDHILRYDPATGDTTEVGTLPKPASDVAVAAIGGTAYVVGGYDGTNWLDTIIAWQPGSSSRVAGRLPVGLRYAAVAAVDGHLIIAGGTTPSGASDAILSFDPTTGMVTQLGRLPSPLTHASAAASGNQLLVVGGRHELEGHQTSTILTIDPTTGAAEQAGHLPVPLSDAAVAAVGSNVIVAGGLNADGAQRSIFELSPSS